MKFGLWSVAMKFLNFKGQSSRSVYLIPFAILAGKALEVILQIFHINFASPPNDFGNWFVANFIQWFGVLYGILVPLILVRVWEQLDNIDREFDREADTVKILYEDLFFLRRQSAKFGKEITTLLRKYVRHVKKNYYKETTEASPEKKVGERILEEVRRQCQHLIYSKEMQAKGSEYIILDVLHKIDEIIDIRGDRIALSRQRLFESLRMIALIASILFIVPFYFVGFYGQSGILDNLLIIGVTLLVIFIYMVIEDLDEPFTGTWKIDAESWQRVHMDIICNERQFELENRGKVKALSDDLDSNLPGSNERRQQPRKKKSNTQGKKAIPIPLSPKRKQSGKA
jgi:CII-binding regulator of phage lambda lysogenization HflD